MLCQTHGFSSAEWALTHSALSLSLEQLLITSRIYSLIMWATNVSGTEYGVPVLSGDLTAKGEVGAAEGGSRQLWCVSVTEWRQK